jgi:hypothetical protein
MESNPFLVKAKLKKPWYRGTDIYGRGMERLFAGDGFYLLWDEQIAYMMAVYNGWKNKLPALLSTWEVDPNLKLLHHDSREYAKARDYVHCRAYGDVDSPIFQKTINRYLADAGYDGIISRLRTQGLLLFDETRAMPSDEKDLGLVRSLPPGWEWDLLRS